LNREAAAYGERRQFVKIAIAVVAFSLLALRPISLVVAQPGDPPFGMTVQTLSVDGSMSMAGTYSADGTFRFLTLFGRQGSNSNREYTGHWWREPNAPNGKFCFEMDPPAVDAGKKQCKPAGHLIGRAMAAVTAP
jgi:hypothetical protein